jgi:dipeptidyl aminopeptidase/acylaminoacyl peptidase
MVGQKSRIILIAFISLFYFNIDAQEIKLSDYDRAISFRFGEVNNKTIFNISPTPIWMSNGEGLVYTHYSKTGKEFKKVATPSGKITPLFDHKLVASSLSSLINETVSAIALPINNLRFPNDENPRFNAKGKTFTINLTSSNVSELKADSQSRNQFESTSPDGKWTAFSKDYNLYIKSTVTNEEFQLSTEGEKNYEYASSYGWYDMIEGENGDRPKRFNVNWSPDSKWIRTNIIDLRTAEKMYLLDWSQEALFKPKLLSYYRGSPGDTTMVLVTPVFYNVDTKKEVKTDLPRGTHVNGTNHRWTNKSGEVLVNYSERGYQALHVKRLDLNSNTSEELINETSETNIDNFMYMHLQKSNQLLFLSERSGWRQLYSHDLSTNVSTPITNGQYFIDNIVEVDEDKGVIYFLASGKEARRNPYHTQFYRIDLDGKNLKLVTEENAHHEVSISPDNNYFFDNYSTVNQPTTSVLRNAKNGKIIKEITKADVSAISAQGWKAPEVFESLGRDGKTKIYGAMWKPSNFDSNKSYPVIDNSYTGPHTQMFPRNFRTGVARNQSLAELGFIVVSVDGMGSSGRSKEFHNYSYRNMGKNLTEHVSAIKELGAKHSWFDSNRVGIFGHSAGGYDAGHAVLEFPDFYKVAVASSGDHDFRMEKAWWPEMYMGWPVDSLYDQVSNVTMARNLKGKLLLVHGGIDDNVNPSATFKMAEALIKADKEFDLLIIPSQKHGYSGDYSKYFVKKRWNYFIEHLHGVKPIWNIDWK